MANTIELSPKWRSLPFDLVQEILDHFTGDIIASCDYNNDYSHEQYSDPGFTDQLYQHWKTFHQDCFFKVQRRRFEQHFQDRWLQNMAIYMKFDLGREATSYHCRYLPFYDTCAQKRYGMLRDTATEEEDKHRDAASERVTFFLSGHDVTDRFYLKNSHLEKEFFFDKVPVRSAIPAVAARAWKQISENDGEACFGVGLRAPGEPFRHMATRDIFRSWSVSKEVAGFEVLHEGRGIRFNWKRVMTEYLKLFSAAMENKAWADTPLWDWHQVDDDEWYEHEYL